MRWRSASVSGDISVCFLVHIICLPEQAPRVQRAGDRPGLRGRAARMERRISVEDLADGPQPLVLERIGYGLEQSFRHSRVAGHAIGSEAERSEQPCPDGPLMIAAVALANVSAIGSPISGITWRQRSQAKGGEKMFFARPHDARLRLGRERTVR